MHDIEAFGWYNNKIMFKLINNWKDGTRFYLPSHGTQNKIFVEGGFCLYRKLIIYLDGVNHEQPNLSILR